MIRVTVELVPFGIEENKKHLGTAIISNDGTGSHASGNYDIVLSKWNNKEDEVWKRDRVEGFNRLFKGAWDLLYIALKNTVGDRNK